MEEINILIVEDNRESARKLEEILKTTGYKYWIIFDPRQVVAMLKSAPFAVVLTELRMPYMNGIEITKAVLGVSPATSVVVMTPYSFITSAVEAMQIGAYSYVTKPFIPAEIKIVLDRAVERYFIMLREDTREYYMGLSVKDGLTGVYNRRFFSIKIKSVLASLREERYKKFSLLLIDIDDFKKYNDTEGHLAGDKLLREIAKTFKESVRSKDVVFRYGGEEFAILLEEAEKKDAELIAERIRTTVSLYHPTTISIGVATFPDDGEDEQTLFSRADQALYAAKRGGKNKVCIA